MRVDVVREIPNRDSTVGPKRETLRNVNLNVADNWAQLSGPGKGKDAIAGKFIADGEVVQMSTAYRGAEYHITLRVDVVTSGERTFGFRRRELWWVTFLKQPEEEIVE